MSSLVVSSVVLFAASLVFLRWWLLGPANLPPGPRGSLFSDSTKDLPATHIWKTFKPWNDKFGPIISFFLGSTPVIVLGTAEAASDLLEKRSEIYSGRPRSIMANEILSGGMRGIGLSPGPRWRRWRSLQSSALSVTAVLQYQPLQTVESSILLRDLLGCENPTEYHTHLLRFVMSTVFCVTYGRRIKKTTDDVVLANKELDQYFLNIPGRFLVESWPSLLYLPRFLQWFRREPERHRMRDSEVYLQRMYKVKEQITKGSAPPSMTSYALERRERFDLNDLELAYALSAPWSAGVETTVSLIQVVILAMLHYPDVMRKAQAELDLIIGHGRLPGFADQNSLQYMQALIKEATRWRPIAPVGFAHATTEDDTYKGFFIPKGSTVYANNFAILADPELFPEPDIFRPERFLENPKNNSYKMAFGYGRRICPGMHIGLQGMYIVISRMLWAFDILPISENGKIYIPSVDDFTGGLLSRPANLKYRLVPRHKGIMDIIILEAEKADMEAMAWQ